MGFLYPEISKKLFLWSPAFQWGPRDLLTFYGYMVFFWAFFDKNKCFSDVKGWRTQIFARKSLEKHLITERGTPNGHFKLYLMCPRPLIWFLGMWKIAPSLSESFWRPIWLFRWFFSQSTPHFLPIYFPFILLGNRDYKSV